MKSDDVCIFSNKMAAHLILKNNKLSSKPKTDLKNNKRLVYFFQRTPKLEEDMSNYEEHKQDLYKSYYV